MKIKLESWAQMPTRAHESDAGLDLYSAQGQVIPAGGSAIFDTGVHVELPGNSVGFIMSKSGLSTKYGLSCLGVIDMGYTGAIAVKLYNHGEKDYCVERGDKIAQLVICTVMLPELEQVESLNETSRGANGFGSSGR